MDETSAPATREIHVAADPPDAAAAGPGKTVGSRLGSLPRVRSRLHVLAVTGDLWFLLLGFVVFAWRTELHGGDLARFAMWCPTLVAVWIATALHQGAYQRAVLARPVQSAYIIAKVTVVAGALFHLLPLVGAPVASRIQALDLVICLTAIQVVWRVALAFLVPRTSSSRPLVIVGAGPQARLLAAGVRGDWRRSHTVLAYLEDDPSLVRTFLDGVPVFPLADLNALVTSTSPPARVALAVSDERHAVLYQQLTALAQAGVQIDGMASVYEEVTGRIPVRHLGSSWWTILPRPSANLLYRAVKRGLDITLGLVGLVVLALVLPVAAVLMRRESPGPLFFTQLRVGGRGRAFRVIKLRTLPVLAGSAAPTDVWTRKRANQPLRVGSFLRATGLDELPQCLNVLRGDMSIVGPRPYVPEEVTSYRELIPFFQARALVKPGLTGWAQVNWSYGLSLDDEVEKLQYDLYYVGHQSLYLDLVIILRTAHVLLRRRRSLCTATAPLLAPSSSVAASPPPIASPTTST